MALSALFLTLLGQEVAPAQTPATFDANVPLTVAEPLRLAITPRLDGILSDEEWDPFADTADSKSYLQWEPGKLHLAALVPKGDDVLFSIDTKDDGWLRGKDNLEIRASLVGEKVVLRGRILDTTGKGGPTFGDYPNLDLASEAVAKEGASGTFYEITLIDATRAYLDPQKGAKYGIRYDAVPAGATEAASYVPRYLSEVRLGTERNAGMPKGLEVDIENGFQTVVPGENMRMRVPFRGTNDLHVQSLDLRSEGEAKPLTLSMTSPFPFFDGRGRAFIDYDTRVASSAGLGYRVMRGTVVAGDGIPGIIEGSYRVAPAADFALSRPTIAFSPTTRVVRMFYTVKSNTVNRVTNAGPVIVPEGWRVVSGFDRGFTITHKNYIVEPYVDVEIPGNTTGIHPIKFTSQLGEIKNEQTVWVTIQ